MSKRYVGPVEHSTDGPKTFCGLTSKTLAPEPLGRVRQCAECNRALAAKHYAKAREHAKAAKAPVDDA